MKLDECETFWRFNAHQGKSQKTSCEGLPYARGPCEEIIFLVPSCSKTLVGFLIIRNRS